MFTRFFMMLYSQFMFIIIGVYCSTFELINATDTKTPVIVSNSAQEDFSTISDAIAHAVPESNSNWIHILVRRGYYREKVIIPQNKQYVVLQGEGRTSTIVTYSSSINLYDATIEVRADNVIVKGITFKNTFNLGDGNKVIAQAVAAFIIGDKVSFYRCGFESVQDTLWDASGRHYFKQCYIQGAIDFIMGNGQSVYDVNNNLSSLNVRPRDFFRGCITAQHRDKAHEPTGFVFKYCVVTGSGKAYLGRAWGPYSRVIFYKSKLADIVVPEGWDAWDYAGNVRRVTYAEDGNTGPGADTSNRVKWANHLTQKQMKFFVGQSFNNADDWIQSQPVDQ